MISVTLDGVAPDDWYDDNRVLLDYAFEQKESRLSANRPITGEVVDFRDPDAARIIAQATPGASVGGLDSTATAAAAIGAPHATPDSTQTPASAGADTGTSGGMNGKLTLAVAVVTVVIAAGVLGSVVGGSGAARASSTD
jgi:hypothetical protein